jgi:hypothetical protein
LIPRSASPSWRWMTRSGIPSRDISTAWACRSWCGANRRRTPAASALRMQLAADRGRGAGPAAGRVAQNAETTRRPAGSCAARARGRAAPTPSGPSRPPAGDRPFGHGPGWRRAAVKLGLSQRQGLADPQPGTPQRDDHRAASWPRAQPPRLGSPR